MSREPDFDQLVGSEGSPEELERLRRVHDLLIAAGPPPELPDRLATVTPPGRVFSLPRPRREALVGLAAAASVALAFGIGVLVANDGGGFSAIRSVPMHALGTSTASAAIEVGKKDASGNWPLLVTVRNLPQVSNGRYELYLTRKGKRVASCGTFAADGGLAHVHLTVPYRLGEYDGWVLTGHAQGQPERVLLTT